MENITDAIQTTLIKILKNKLKLEAVPYNGPVFEGFLVTIILFSQ